MAEGFCNLCEDLAGNCHDLGGRWAFAAAAIAIMISAFTISTLIAAAVRRCGAEGPQPRRLLRPAAAAAMAEATLVAVALCLTADGAPLQLRSGRESQPSVGRRRP